jgi:hypothetical protein
MTQLLPVPELHPPVPGAFQDGPCWTELFCLMFMARKQPLALGMRVTVVRYR